MRIAVVLALLGLSASCAVPPPEAAAPPPSASTAAGTPIPLLAPAPPIASAPPPAALAATAPAPSAPILSWPGGPGVEFVPVGGLLARMLTAPPPPGRLMLSNFSFEDARLQAVLASGPDCPAGDAGAVAEFVLPPNGTRILPAPPGADICWRRELPPVAGDGKAALPPWSEWNRAFTGPGRYLHSVL